MGVWDEMCLVCGGPPAAFDVAQIAEIARDLAQESDTLALSPKQVRDGLRGTAWLAKYVGIDHVDALRNVGAYDNYGAFRLSRDTAFHGATNFRFDNVPDGQPFGLTCHRACHALLAEKLKYKLRFADVWPTLMRQQQQGNYFTSWSYGGINKYHAQDFDVVALLEDGNAWMLQDPRRNERNSARILRVWRPFVARLRTKP